MNEWSLMDNTNEWNEWRCLIFCCFGFSAFFSQICIYVHIFSYICFFCLCLWQANKQTNKQKKNSLGSNRIQSKGWCTLYCFWLLLLLAFRSEELLWFFFPWFFFWLYFLFVCLFVVVGWLIGYDLVWFDVNVWRIIIIMIIAWLFHLIFGLMINAFFSG